MLNGDVREIWLFGNVVIIKLFNEIIFIYIVFIKNNIWFFFRYFVIVYFLKLEMLDDKKIEDSERFEVKRIYGRKVSLVWKIVFNG